MTPPLRVTDLGLLDYQSAWERQLELVAARQQGAVTDTLLLVEHPHVITVGRAQRAKANVLAAGDVAVVEIERGGDVTYHGPGQLVAYPILQLAEGERDLHRFLRNLEEAIILAAGDAGLADAGRRAGATGVWVDAGTDAPRKLASIGIACRRWVTFHGLALNVTTDLAQFQRINPCGFDASVMTSLAAELGGATTTATCTVAALKPLLARRLAETLGRALSWQP